MIIDVGNGVLIRLEEKLSIEKSKTIDMDLLSEAVWICKSSNVFDGVSNILKLLYKAMLAALPGYRIWLFLGNYECQPDTRIVRYRKLWKAMESRGVSISHDADRREMVNEDDGCLKFFGATSFSELSIRSVVSAILTERCSYIVMAPSGREIDTIIQTTWSGYLNNDISLIKEIYRDKGLLFKCFGEFDDCESGFIGIGEKPVLKSMVESARELINKREKT